MWLFFKPIFNTIGEFIIILHLKYNYPTLVLLYGILLIIKLYLFLLLN